MPPQMDLRSFRISDLSIAKKFKFLSPAFYTFIIYYIERYLLQQKTKLTTFTIFLKFSLIFPHILRDTFLY